MNQGHCQNPRGSRGEKEGGRKGSRERERERERERRGGQSTNKAAGYTIVNQYPPLTDEMISECLRLSPPSCNNWTAWVNTHVYPSVVQSLSLEFLRLDAWISRVDDAYMHAYALTHNLSIYIHTKVRLYPSVKSERRWPRFHDWNSTIDCRNSVSFTASTKCVYYNSTRITYTCLKRQL